MKSMKCVLAFCFGLTLLSACQSRKFNTKKEAELKSDSANNIELNSNVNGVLLQSFHWYTAGEGVHWKALTQKASAYKEMGITAVWLPPAYKGSSEFDVGYGVYDIWDLGEFKQKNSNLARTKYGTKSEYLKLIDTLHSNGI